MLQFDSFGEPHQQVPGGLVEGHSFGAHDALVRFDGTTQNDQDIIQNTRTLSAATVA